MNERIGYTILKTALILVLVVLLTTWIIYDDIILGFAMLVKAISLMSWPVTTEAVHTEALKALPLLFIVGSLACYILVLIAELILGGMKE